MKVQIIYERKMLVFFSVITCTLNVITLDNSLFRQVHKCIHSYHLFSGQGPSAGHDPGVRGVHVLCDQPAARPSQPLRTLQRRSHDQLRGQLLVSAHAKQTPYLLANDRFYLLQASSVVHMYDFCQPSTARGKLHHELCRLLLFQQWLQESHLWRRRQRQGRRGEQVEVGKCGIQKWFTGCQPIVTR
jgi:hypothetical protein